MPLATPGNVSSRKLVGLFLLIVVEPSLGIVEKYSGGVGVAVFIMIGVSVAIVLAYRIDSLHTRLSERGADICAAVAIVVVLAVTLFVYPRANVHVAMHGSDRDDALFQATNALLHGSYPYTNPTYLGNPITPMPGALLLAIPFVLAHNVGLANVFWCALLFVTAQWWWRDSRPALVALLVSLGSPEVMHDIATGGDLFANGVYVAILILLAVVLITRSNTNAFLKAGAIALLGIGLSSRPTYWFCLPVVFQYVRRRVGLRTALGWSAIAVTMLATLTAPFYFASPKGFAPVHLAAKMENGGGILPHANIVVPALTAALALGSMMPRLGSPNALLFAVGLIVAAPTYLLTIVNFRGATSHNAWEFLEFGMGATGPFALALGGFIGHRLRMIGRGFGDDEQSDGGSATTNLTRELLTKGFPRLGGPARHR